MTSGDERDGARAETNASLRAERERSDEELLERSEALAEDADDIIERARERARLVLALARQREDDHIATITGTTGVISGVAEARRVEDAALSAEHTVADKQRLDERERRHAAMVELLAHERTVTDRRLSAERDLSDRGLTDREDLLALVAHDARNMLGLIMVNASVILLSDNAELAKRSAALIQRAGAQAAAFLEDLLDVSSSSAGKLALAIGDVDAADLVRDAVKIHEAAAADAGVTLVEHVLPASVDIRADGKRMTRVVVNLISNALKFTPAGGRIDVSVGVAGDECEISVRDTGVGIPAGQLDEIFERYRKLGRETNQSFGVGLGLYISRLITDAHGGRIWAESEPGVGSTFRVRIPMR